MDNYCDIMLSTLGGKYYCLYYPELFALRKEVVLMKAKLEPALNTAALIVTILDLTVKFVRSVASAVDANDKASS